MSGERDLRPRKKKASMALHVTFPQYEGDLHDLKDEKRSQVRSLEGTDRGWRKREGLALPLQTSTHIPSHSKHPPTFPPTINIHYTHIHINTT